MKKISRRAFAKVSLGTAAVVAALSPKSASADTSSPFDDRVFDSASDRAKAGQVSSDGTALSALSSNDTSDLSECLMRAFNAKYGMLAGGKRWSESTGKGYFARPLADRVGKDVEDRIAGISRDGLRYTDYSFDHQIEGAWGGQDVAAVVWTEKISLSFGGETDPNVPRSYVEVKKHLTSFRRDAKEWRIVEDDSEFGQAKLPSLGIELGEASLSDRKLRMPDLVVGGGRTQQKSDFAGHRDETPGTAAIGPQYEQNQNAALGGYNRSNAASYAVNKAYTPDGFGSGKTGYYDWGNNCTNFVSQCLRAGGWTDVLGFYSSSSAWWYNGLWPKYGSYTWAGAENLYWFLSSSGRGTRIYNPYDLWYGDVLQFDFDRNNSIDHAQICHYRSTSGVCYMAQHTSSYAWKPLSDILAGKNWWTYSWRLKTSF